MTAAKANRGDGAEGSKFLADRYRQGTFDLLKAARVLRDTGDQLRATRQQVAPTAVADLREALDILDGMPSVAAANRAKT